MNNKIKYFLWIMTVILAMQNASSQVDLHRKISINVQNLFIPQTLHFIEQNNDFFFAYNPKQIPANDRVSINKRNVALNKVLDEILSNRFAYTTIGNHVILRLKGVNSETEDFIVLGVIESSDGFPLDSVVVYAVKENKAVITDINGTFRLKLNEPSQYIHVSCPNYKDTLLIAKSLNGEKTIKLNREFVDNRTTVLPLTVPGLDIMSAQAQFEKSPFVRNLVPQSALYLQRQVKTNRMIPFQISFLPGMGSQQLTKGLNINYFSLNILAGYSKGVSGFEIGSLANITQENINGGQVGGIANIVNGHISGMQVAGVFNYTFGKIRGAQISGVENISNNNIVGLQIAGVSNNNKGTVNGAQVSGVLNTNLQKIIGLQLAGVANIQTNELNGCQISGIYGIASNIKGVQLAGVMSHTTRNVSGLQVSSILNKTKTLNGLQIGIINIADSIDNGLQIGLFNIVRNGYRAFEFTKDETFYCNFMYKTGGKRLYSILNAGIGENIVSTGYGVGYIQPIYKQFSVNLDAVYSTLLATNTSSIYFGNLLNVRLAANYRLHKHLVLTSGLSLNFYDPNKEDLKSGSADGISFSWNSSNTISQAFQNNRKAVWVGGFFGIKF
ncbi:MAG: hypothetical protein H6Q20_1527 [Bacteroidetes bacterium]|nr:hypothetical protein [Bacteroidota bacterium]